jgi:hypothetical protein
MIYFTVGDLKGLLTEAHSTDAYDLIEGERDIVTRTKDDELKAIVFHQVLLNWVSNGKPVIMDMTKKPEVRNHPVYKCQMTTQPDQSNPEKTHVTATLWLVSCGVSADYVGTRDFQATYQYWITGDFQNPSDGDWEGSSQNDHPGLIWRPTYVNADPRLNPNPAVKYYDPYILQLLNNIESGVYVAIPDLEPRDIERPIIPDMPPHSGISAFHTRSRPPLRERRLLREGRQMSPKNPGKRHPEWREGTWWQIQVRQRAVAAMEEEVGWTQPFRLFFEVIREEVVEDRPCYRVQVTYPDRPRSAEYQYADVWVTKDERAMLKGRLQIGGRSIPMRNHFLMELLKATHLEVNAEGIHSSPLDPRWPERKVELQAFEGRSPNGGSYISSLAAPFPLRIEEPTYIVELTDWGI